MEITLPHNFTPRKYQLGVLRAFDKGIKRLVIVWNRRSGKDKVCFNIMIREAMKRVGTYYYFLPTYSQAKKVIWDNIDNSGFKMLDHIPKELIKSTNGTELKIELINGSIIQLIAADEFKNSGVGTNPVGVVFSEYSVSSPEAWSFVSPILAANGGWAIFNFTPRGMNHAHTILAMAQDMQDKWFSEILTLNETKVITEEQLEDERRMHPSDFIEQEYFCKFIEGAGAVFKRIDDNVKVMDAKPDPQRKYRMGVDLAKYNDYTVISVLDLMTFNVIHIERFNQIDYNLQKARIEALYHKYFKPLITIDSTGVGEPIFEDLQKAGLNINPFRFTEQTRKDLLNNLAILLEQGKIKIPDYEVLISELRSFQYTLTENGKVKMKVPDGLHDDTVMSLGLVCWELPTNPLPVVGSIRHMTVNQKITPISYE